ncbi:MAG: response regulator [Phyllobacteriaceae bacterium]|nr:response regulator [Phyllobacteriaceae bacterium]
MQQKNNSATLRKRQGFQAGSQPSFSSGTVQKSGFMAPEPMIDQNPRRAGVTRLLLLGTVLIGAGVAFVLARDSIGEEFLLTALGVFAMIGIFYLFASVIGFIQIAPRTASDALSKAFLDSQPQGVVITDKRDRVIYANRAYAEITGAARPSDVRSVGALFGHEAEASGVIYRMSQHSAEGGTTEQEVRLDRPLGARTADAAASGAAWYRLRARAMTTETMLRKFFVWQIVDITGERLEQERYFLQVQQAISHLDQAPAGFIATDRLHNITHINATLAHWLGLDLASFVPGKLNLADLVAGDGMALVRAANSRDGARNAVFDLDLLKTGGAGLPVRFLHGVHRGPDGVPVGTRTVVLNRADGDQSTDEVRNAEVRFTRFFNSTPMAIAGIDAAGAILRTNAPFVSLFGDTQAPNGMMRKLESFIHPRDRISLQRAIAAAAAGQADIPALETVFAADEERHLRIFVNAVVGGADGAADESAIVYALETTEQKALEAQMAQGQKMQAVGQLAGGIAHDFNNVLSAIIMSSDLLLQNQRPSDPSFMDIMSIKQNANRAASLVRQLLAFSRRQTLRPETLDLTDVLADIRMLVSRLVGNNVDLKIEHGRDLWPVRADMGQLQQVITNLCINARDAMPHGGGITISTRNLPGADVVALGRKEMPEIDYVIVAVRDTGTGIAPENIKKIFEPFFTTKEVGKGTGLGLSMVYGIIKQSGGFIYVDSELGKGTEFQILLPRHVADAVDETKSVEGGKPAAEGQGAKPAPALAPEAQDLSGQGIVLLVEDEDAVRMGGVRALKSRGYTVIEATTGVEALEAFIAAKGSIDLIVSDVVMPEMDGPTLLGEVRKIQPDIKFIFVSGYAEDAFARNLPSDAKFGFLPKPFSLKQLATTVKEWMDKPV